MSQVISYIPISQYITATPEIDFNRQAVQSLNISVSQQRKTLFSSFPLTGFLHLFLHLFPPCVTLVTAKKLNRCWYARYTHAWDSFPSHRLFSLLFFEANTQKSSQSRILASRDCISNTRKENHSLFCDFFPLWGYISPYTYRGARWRCTPFSFFFHGESHSHIYADTSDNIVQRQSAESASFERESCTFTNIQSRFEINPNRSLDRSL